MTRQQKVIVDRIAQATGWVITTQKMIGKKVWIVAERDRKCVYTDEHMYGTIGPLGAVNLKYDQFCNKYKITDAAKLYRVLLTNEEAIAETRKSLEYIKQFVS